jgi:cytochrome P450 family 142 subfamily A polypeptide 1
MILQDVQIPFLAGESWDERMPERVRWLRRNDPVHWSEPDGLWLISKYEDLVRISKDQALFTSNEGVRPGRPVRIGLIDEPEPRHGQLRGLINRGFTPRMVKKLQLTFEHITTRAIDAVAASGECDFVTDIAVPLPLQLIASMIGIREEDWGRFHQWSDAMIAADGNEHDPEILVRASAAFLEYANYVGEIIEDRRRRPQDDLVSILAGAKDEGLLRRFDERESTRRLYGHRTDEEVELANDELIKMLVILLVAGNETTRNGISGGMQLLIENPGQREKLVRDPALIPRAVEEMLRLVSPVRNFGRTVVQDTELRGKKLEAGQQVLLLYGSANRDEEVFEDPDAFRVERNPQHVAFGIGGHFCLGANLARMEMQVAFRELLQRIPDMEYSRGGPTFSPSALVRSCTHMHVRFTPELPLPRSASA